MNRVISHAEASELLGAFALNATDDFETSAIDDHVERCEGCRTELVEFLDAAAAIGGSHPAQPLAAVWDRVLAAIESDPEVGLVDQPPSAPLATVHRLDGRRATKRAWQTAALAAAAAVAVVVPITASLSSRPTASLDVLAAKADSAPAARHFTLADSHGTILAKAVLTKDGTGYLLDTRLPSLPPGRTYQLWAVIGHGNPPVSAAILGRRPGTAAFTVNAPTDALAISVEPAHGSLSATSAPIAVGSYA